MNINAILNEFSRRLRQPTTMAGLSAIGLLVGLPPGTVSAITQVVVAASALLAILIDDGSNAPATVEQPGWLMGKLFGSADNGDSWEMIQGSLPEINCVKAY